MKFLLLLFGGRGAGSGRYSYYLPKNPAKSSRLEDISHPIRITRTPDRTYYDKEKGLEIEFHPKKNGEEGWKGKDHYHVKNPNSKSKLDYYLDKNGNPCPRGSNRSHLLPGEYENLLRSLEK